jgi:hypothetical protein
MFNKNKIEVVEEELLQLFFKDKNVRPEDAYLDFYQFMQFALSKEADQHYRNFMRKVKIRLLKKKEEEMNKKKEIMKIKHESEIERKRYDPNHLEMMEVHLTSKILKKMKMKKKKISSFL